MGSCLSKPSGKGHTKKKKKETTFEEVRDASVLKDVSRKVSEEGGEEKVEVEGAVPSKHVIAAASPPQYLQANQASQQPLPVPSLPSTGAVESQEQQLPLASPSAKKQCPSPSLSPDPGSLPHAATQTPLRNKYSGEFPINSQRKPSSPCKALLLKMPSSPAALKKSTSSNRNEEDDCKFPSLARKQWLSQACVTKGSGEDEPLTTGSKASAGEITSKERTSSTTETLTLTSRETTSTVSKEWRQKTTGKMRQESDSKTMGNASKFPHTETPTLTGKTAASRTNSLSRDLSPVDSSRAKARPSSPLKRSPSIKDHPGVATDGPQRLMRSSSGKVSSPNRSGLHAVERQESLKARPLHKQSFSKEYITDPTLDPSAHKRSSSRDSVSEFSAEIIRKPSPPKKTSVVVPSSTSLSSLDAGRLHAKRPSTPSKESFSSHRSIIQEPSSIIKGGRVSAQRSLSTTVHESADLTASSNNRNGKRKEKSPLRRTCNGMATMHNSTRNSDRAGELSINSDTTAASQFDLVGKDLAARTRRPASRMPLKEITDNSTRVLSSKQGAKENSRAAPKASDILPVYKADDAKELHLKEELTKGYASIEKTDEKVVCDLSSTLSDYIKDPLEVKAESLVMGGKSVLSAFKALEEYRLKYSNLSLESHQGTEENTWYSRPQPLTADKENFSLPFQGSEMGKALPKSNPQQAQDLPRSRSAKKSCEQFFFPDVQSLLMSENEGLQLEGGMTMPASISKACSILRAVADLNMGTSTYPKKKEVDDEIERPNLLSFQFGDGDSDRVMLS